MKVKAKDLATKRRVTLSIDIDLDDHFTDVSKELGFTKSMIVSELLKQHLNASVLDIANSNVIRSLEFRKEQLGLIGKEMD